MQQVVMLNTRPADVYRKQDIMTASSVDLIIMLYDALRKNIALGRKRINNKNVPAAHEALMKAQDIVQELINCLDMNYEIAEELLSIYEFILSNLGDANLQKNAEMLEPVLEMVDSLRSAWQEISSQSKGSLYMSEGQEA